MTTAIPTPPASASSAPAHPPSARATARPPRLDSVDLLRGLVMVIMVLDHTRDFAFAGTLHFGATDLTQTTPAIFFTRWITHFCAPIFVFLAGTGIMLQRLRGKPLPELSRFLVTRGLWLIVLEFTAVRIGWLWNLDYDRFIGMAQVIWAIGWGMIIMAALIRLPVTVVFALGLAITFLHDLLTPFFGPFMTPPGAPTPTLGADLFMILFSRGGINDGTLDDYRDMLRAIKNAHARPVVTLVPYQGSEVKKADITKFNDQLRQLCNQENVTVVDLNPDIAPHGVLLPEYAGDGVHFSQLAYGIWQKKLREVIAAN